VLFIDPVDAGEVAVVPEDGFVADHDGLLMTF
jgi:hypothetical protein